MQKSSFHLRIKFYLFFPRRCQNILNFSHKIMHSQHWIEQLSPEKASQFIHQALILLKRQGISQAEVAYKIGYDSLSKARYFLKYRNQNSNLIAGMDMRQVLQHILDAYHLTWNDETQQLETKKTGEERQHPLKAISEDAVYYLYHYYTDTIRGVNQGVLAFRTTKKVELTLYSPFDKTQFHVWEGTYQFIGMYLFLELQTNETHPLKGIHTYFSGIPNTWQTYYAGTYSGIRADGTLLVGKGLLTKAENEAGVMAQLDRPVAPEIVAYLHGGVVTVKTQIIHDLSALANQT